MTPEAATPPHGALFYVAAVNIVIWVGLFAYLLYLDRKVTAAENARKSSEINR